MGLLDKPGRVRVHVYLDPEQRAEIQRIAEQEGNGVTASQVHRAALTLGLPEVRRTLEREQVDVVPWHYPPKGGSIEPGHSLLDPHADTEGETGEVEP